LYRCQRQPGPRNPDQTVSHNMPNYLDLAPTLFPPPTRHYILTSSLMVAKWRSLQIAPPLISVSLRKVRSNNQPYMIQSWSPPPPRRPKQPEMETGQTETALVVRQVVAASRKLFSLAIAKKKREKKKDIRSEPSSPPPWTSSASTQVSAHGWLGAGRPIKRPEYRQKCRHQKKKK
jgi:hypothetical protein